MDSKLNGESALRPRCGPLVAAVKQALRDLRSQLCLLNHRVGARLALNDVDLDCLDLIARADPEYLVVESPQVFFHMPMPDLVRSVLQQHTERFRLETVIPVESNHPSFRGVSLEVYRNLRHGDRPAGTVLHQEVEDRVGAQAGLDLKIAAIAARDADRIRRIGDGTPVMGEAFEEIRDRPALRVGIVLERHAGLAKFGLARSCEVIAAHAEPSADGDDGRDRRPLPPAYGLDRLRLAQRSRRER